MKHYSSISPKTVGRGEENRKFGLCTMATAQMSERLYCLVLVSSCLPSAVFTAYCTWICQPWGHFVSWNTLANIRKSRAEKRKSEQVGVDWSKSRFKKSSTVEGLRQSQEIGRGEVVLWKSCLAKTSSLCFPLYLFIFNEKDIWCRQWRWSIFSHSSALCQELPF